MIASEIDQSRHGFFILNRHIFEDFDAKDDTQLLKSVFYYKSELRPADKT